MAPSQRAFAAICSLLVFGVAVSATLSDGQVAADLADGGAAESVNSAFAADPTHQRTLAEDRSAFVYGNEVPAWRGRLDTTFGRDYFAPAQANNKCKNTVQNCSMIPGQSFPYEQYLVDPTDPNSGRPIMKVSYPAGAWSTSAPQPGGTLFYSYPYKWDPISAQDPLSIFGATLEYEVYFPTGFDWVKGGKLPGFGGGKANGRGCGGGVDPAECFSYRIMWRNKGWGEAYLYVPHYMQSSEFCGLPRCNGTKVQPCTICDYEAGVSFYRGAWVFQTGTWTKLRLHMKLNTPNVTDGVITLDVNGQQVINMRTMNWRQYPNIFIEGLTFATWFGGSDQTWAPTTDQYTMFRNFRIYYDAAGEGARTASTMSFDPSNPPANWHGPVQTESYLSEQEPKY
jgi:hypothetical protein